MSDNVFSKTALARVNDLSQKISEEFLSSYVLRNQWYGSAIATGTGSQTASVALHPGITQYLSHASNTNSGYKFHTDGNSILISGGVKTTFIFKTGTTTAGVTRRMGFHDINTEAAVNDGVFLLQNGVTLTGETAANTTGSTTGSSYTLSGDTWYRGVIEMNSDATLATFKLYADNSSNLLWQDTLATNIPTATGRETKHGDLCLIAAPGGSAKTIGSIDYIDIIIPNVRLVI